jgi:long-chain acyl-CoA synthetase
VNLASIIDGHPDDATAIVSRGRPSTYGTLRTQTASLRKSLMDLGLERGDRVAILCGNNRYFVVSYLAAIGAGLIVAPLNPTSPTAAIEKELLAVDAAAVIAGPMAKPAVMALDRTRIPGLRHLIGCGFSIDGGPDWDDLVKGPGVGWVDVASDEVAVLMFTSGTAGLPKAAMLSHGNIEVNMRQITAHKPDAMGPDSVVLGVAPMYHIMGLNVMLGMALYSGAAVVLIERFDPISALESVVKHGVTDISGPPTMWGAWAAIEELPADVFNSVRQAISGAAKLPQSVAERMLDRFDLNIREGYGLTEASPVVATSNGTEAPFGSIGIPVPGLEMRLVDEDGEDTLVGDPGEMWIRGPNIFHGYFRNQEATDAVLDEDGWLHTGDIALIDDAGYLYLVDRSKDLIIVSGFNVFPREVEEAMVTHPGVAEVAVIGVPHPHTGESVLAYVVLEPGWTLDEETLIRHCNQRLARYKCPKKVWFVDAIPQDLGGKVLRRMLREAAE